MATLELTINDDLCTRCGLCTMDCPVRILEQHADDVPIIQPENEEKCMQCQHCLAVCPTGALSILGKKPEDSLPASPGQFPDVAGMERLIRGRRSVRRYQDQNVEPGLLQSLLKTVANAPTGANTRALTFNVIDDREVMQAFRMQALQALRDAMAAGRVPEQAGYLQAAVPAYFDHDTDIILRGAPHVLLVSASPAALCPHEDVTLALAYFELLAQSAGLGTVWCGMLKMLLETLPGLKPLLGLPADDHYYAMLFGHPFFHYARTVQRDDAATIQTVSLPPP